jgi:hypothetical protein
MNYFNKEGFERWRKIYGETSDVNKVQLDIRKVCSGLMSLTLMALDHTSYLCIILGSCHHS